MKLVCHSRTAETFDMQLTEGNEIIADATFQHSNVPFEKAWEMIFIEVSENHRRRGIATKIYRWARAQAAIRECRLLPGPDLTWDEFYFWMKMDPEAVLEVLTHRNTPHIVEDAVGDLETFKEQLIEVIHDLLSRSSPSASAKQFEANSVWRILRSS